MVGRSPNGKTVYSKKTTADTPLSEQERLYVQYAAKGLPKRVCLDKAGYDILRFPNAQQMGSFANRLEKRPNIKAALIIARAEHLHDAVTAPPPPPPGVNQFDPINISSAWINAQAHHVFTEALSAQDFGACLRSLDFMARYNKLVETPRGRGRPPTVKTPNEGDVSGNYVEDDADDNNGGTSKTPDADSIFVGLDDGDGDDSASGYTEPFFKKRGPGRPPSKTVRRERTDRVSKRDVGLAREDGEGLSGEAEGE